MRTHPQAFPLGPFSYATGPICVAHTMADTHAPATKHIEVAKVKEEDRHCRSAGQESVGPVHVNARDAEIGDPGCQSWRLSQLYTAVSRSMSAFPHCGATIAMKS